MMRQSPSRSHRGRGWKVKHVLQILVLVAVCVWLAYQVKHSHDKKKALEGGNMKVSDMVDDVGMNILKLGRKDPRGNVVIIDTDSTPLDDEEEGKRAEEAAEYENRQEEKEGETKGIEGVEAEEDGEEKAEEETGDGDETEDDEDSKAASEDDLGLSEDGQDHDGAEEGSHEAREEQYRADDASSAVVRDAREIAQEDEVLNADDNTESEEKAEVEEFDNGGGANVTGDASSNGGEEVLQLKLADGEEGQQHHNTTFVDAAAGVEKVSSDESHSNTSVAAESDAHIEAHSDTNSTSDEKVEQSSDGTASEHVEQQSSDGTASEHVEQQSSDGTASEHVDQQSSSSVSARDEQATALSVSEEVDDKTAEAAGTHENATAVDVTPAEDQSKLQESRTLEEEDGSNIGSNSMPVHPSELRIELPSNATEAVDSGTVEATPANSTTVNEAAENSSSENAHPAEETEKSNLTTGEEGAGEHQHLEAPSATGEKDDAAAAGQGESSGSGDRADTTTEQGQESRTNQLSTLPEAGEGTVAAE